MIERVIRAEMVIATGLGALGRMWFASAARRLKRHRAGKFSA